MVGMVLAVAAAAIALAAGIAPAALLDGPLAARTQQRLRFVDATGVWWHGRGVVASADGLFGCRSTGNSMPASSHAARSSCSSDAPTTRRCMVR
jgi:hypothetical protein